MAARREEGSEGDDDADSGDESENSDAPNEEAVARERRGDQSFDATGNREEGRSGEREFLDATIKMVRLLANLSIDSEIGTMLGSRVSVLEVSLQ